jgi:hypothetical protein
VCSDDSLKELRKIFFFWKILQRILGDFLYHCRDLGGFITVGIVDFLDAMKTFRLILAQDAGI